jgi:hypothetical protein
MSVPRIFISYRRQDSAAHAGRLNDRLCAAFGAERVFMDVDDIAPGQNFAAALRSNVDAAAVVLVMMGPAWLAAAGDDGRRRLDDEQDFVRFEIATALQRGKRVIPILVNGAAMPAAGSLPPDLQPLALCQALPLTDARFDRDTGDLIQALGGGPHAATHRWRWLAVAAAGVLAAVAGWQLMGNGIADSPPAAPSAAPQQADVLGTWEAEVEYEWSHRRFVERFTFRSIGGALTGTASFLGVPRGMVAAEIRGNAVAFETRSSALIGDQTIEYVHRYRGEVSGDRLRMAMQTSGGQDSGVPRQIDARRIATE